MICFNTTIIKNHFILLQILFQKILTSRHFSIYLIILFLVHSVRGQNKDSLHIKSTLVRVDMGAFYTRFISSNLYGIHYDYQVYIRSRLATGVSLSLAAKNISQTFQYNIHHPRLTFNEIAWKNHYDILQSRIFDLGINLNNGLLYTELCDNDTKVKFFTKYSFAERAKPIVRNYFYLLEPGIDASWKLFSSKENLSIYFTLKAKYRTVIGAANFAKTENFNNFYVGASVSLCGIFPAKAKTHP